jgi:hypothetical protein
MTTTTETNKKLEDIAVRLHDFRKDFDETVDNMRNHVEELGQIVNEISDEINEDDDA